MLQGDRIPVHIKDPANWLEPMRLEWGDDDGITAHKAHRAQIFDAFRRIRQEIDAFKPDVIVIWGDDQYENFREDIIPPFCVLAYDDLHFQPFQRLGERLNIWGEPQDQVFKAAGHREAGRYLASGLLEDGTLFVSQRTHHSRLIRAARNRLFARRSRRTIMRDLDSHHVMRGVCLEWRQTPGTANGNWRA